ncbi:hypothetical protein A9B99_14550 [Mangrovibacter phragmitis]|jgi:hypothetical protein|uniref:Modulator protein MzrA n=1 Tax=Mangrovibacter phragmitis TaxID=1691903 RepID=A0A1B7KZT0_9ENTR|nr:EnvZ/OmpR regulon moderator MzrA [Mangrovibacter phragmitis]OAT75528.1 hypothetical protein A9B99_14550 [Mangrovibacter phragmitis]
MKLFHHLTNNRAHLAIVALLLICASTVFWAATRKPDTTLEIRPAQAGATIPDGFFVWHHLDANGIRVKSITPDNNKLVIKFDSNVQSEAAARVLSATLPHGYVITPRQEPTPFDHWLARLGVSPSRIG